MRIPARSTSHILFHDSDARLALRTLLLDFERSHSIPVKGSPIFFSFLIGNSRAARRRPPTDQCPRKPEQRAARFVRTIRKQMARNLIFCSARHSEKRNFLVSLSSFFPSSFSFHFLWKNFANLFGRQLPFAFGCECSAASDCHSINRHVNQSFSFRVSVISGSFGDLGGGRNGSGVLGCCNRG